MSSYKSKVLEKIGALGASIDGPTKVGLFPSEWAVDLWAPRGKVWTHTGTHCVCAGCGATQTEMWGNAWRDIKDEGLEPCPDGDECDICATIDEED